MTRQYANALVTFGLLSAIPMLSPRASALEINLQFDSTVTSLPNAAQFEAATQYAANQIDSMFTNPVTLQIVVSTGSFGGTNASSGTPYFGSNGLAPINPSVPYVNFTYQQVVQALTSNVTSSADAIALSHLPSTDPTNGVGFVMG